MKSKQFLLVLTQLGRCKLKLPIQFLERVINISGQRLQFSDKNSLYNPNLVFKIKIAKKCCDMRLHFRKCTYILLYQLRTETSMMKVVEFHDE